VVAAVGATGTAVNFLAVEVAVPGELRIHGSHDLAIALLDHPTYFTLD
jgi:hypothetical protein